MKKSEELAICYQNFVLIGKGKDQNTLKGKARHEKKVKPKARLFYAIICWDHSIHKCRLENSITCQKQKTQNFQSSPVGVGFWKRDGPEMRDLDMKMCSQIYCRSDADRVSSDTENDTIWQWYFSQSSKVQFLIIFNNKNKYGRM